MDATRPNKPINSTKTVNKTYDSGGQNVNKADQLILNHISYLNQVI
jgi:hypothetical protein